MKTENKVANAITIVLVEVFVSFVKDLGVQFYLDSTNPVIQLHELFTSLPYMGNSGKHSKHIKSLTQVRHFGGHSEYKIY
jgi:hypothetical protein